uniref:RdRp n=1 Tax=viral metagenome TaxID=1070528 RepID=A0A2V0RBI0_9ZZZZ
MYKVNRSWLTDNKDELPKTAYLKLTNLMNSIQEGNDTVILSPIAKRDGWDNIREDWIKFYSSLDKSNWPDALIEMEESQQDKLGPRSIAKPWSEVRKSVYDYFESSSGKLVCNDSVLSPFKTAGMRVLRPLSTEQTIQRIKKSTSSGLPFVTRKGDVIAVTMSDSMKALSRFWPAAMYERTQEQGKTRVVWGIALGQILREAPFFFPLLKRMSDSPWLSALLGPEAVDIAMDRLIKYAILNDLSIVTIDFSRFDTTVKGSLMDCSWEVIRNFFQPSYSGDLDSIESDFRNVGILCPDGLVSGEHGIPSGSMFTNIVGSISHAVASLSTELVDINLSQILGDDGVHLVRSESVDEFLDSFEQLGMIVNKEKSLTSDRYSIFLQKLFHPDINVNGQIKGVYPINRGFNRLCNMERYDNFKLDGISGADYFAIRDLSIMENSKYHPAFREYVLWWASKSKYPGIPSDKGIRDYVERISDFNGTEGILVNQYGDNIRGIKTWKSYQILSEESA